MCGHISEISAKICEQKCPLSSEVCNTAHTEVTFKLSSFLLVSATFNTMLNLCGKFQTVCIPIKITGFCPQKKKQ